MLLQLIIGNFCAVVIVFAIFNVTKKRIKIIQNKIIEKNKNCLELKEILETYRIDFDIDNKRGSTYDFLLKQKIDLKQKIELVDIEIEQKTKSKI